MWLTSVLLPAPETPVTHTKRPSGKAALTSFRLFSRAPITLIRRPSPLRRAGGSAIASPPRRERPGRPAPHPPPQVPAGQARPGLLALRRGPRAPPLAAVAAGPGAEVDQPVR